MVKAFFEDWSGEEKIEYMMSASELMWWLHEHMDELPPKIVDEIGDKIYRWLEP